ncbi:hypothetical protein BSKO_08705 [Bryopsis sp. KO-2023]|nr:hypothetical protein BSKO_03545 [Bryopsis sp. KO-2023]GMH40801.1 hypothetical protein BSKO_08705 [Bryopsis sp. KO-2023]
MAELARLRAQRQSSPGGTKVFPNPEDDYEHGMRAHFPATFSRKAAEGPEIMKLHENMRRGQSTKDDKTDDGGEIAPEEQNPVSSSRDETVWPPVDDASPSWDGMNDDEDDDDPYMLREKDLMDQVKARRPDPGMAVSGLGKGGKLGATGGTLLTQHLLRTRGKMMSVDEERDPREALLRHANEKDAFSLCTAAYKKTQPEPIFADVEEEGEEDEADRKGD